MSEKSIFEEVQETVDRAVEELKAYKKELQPYLSQAVPGAREMDDAEFLAYVKQTKQSHPPEPIGLPDGRWVFESPGILAWQFIEEAKSEYARYVSIFGTPPFTDPPPGMEDAELD